LAQIRKNGIERGRMSRMTSDGRPEEARYELRFVHGDKIEKDKLRVDQKTAQQEFSLINTEGRVFGIINGSVFTPRAETAAEFLSQQTHSIDAKGIPRPSQDRKSTRLNSSHLGISYAVFCLKKKKLMIKHTVYSKH